MPTLTGQETWSWLPNCKYCVPHVISWFLKRALASLSFIIGWNRAVALNLGGAQHRKFRRLLNKSLNSTAVRDYRLLQEHSAQALARLLLESPQDFLKHVRTTVSKSIINISYGYDVKVKDQDYIDYAEDVPEVFGVAAKPYAFMVDLIPFCVWDWDIVVYLLATGSSCQCDTYRHGFLGSDSKGRLWSGDETSTISPGYPSIWSRQIWCAAHFFVLTSIQLTWDQMNGDAPDSYVASQLHALKVKPTADTCEDDIMWTAASLYTGGSDTVHFEPPHLRVTVALIYCPILRLLLDLPRSS